MKITKEFIYNLKIFTGCFFMIVCLYHAIRISFFPVVVRVDKLDVNEDGEIDTLHVYHNEMLIKEQIDQVYCGVYDIRVNWNKDGSIKKKTRMLDSKYWIVEFYNPPVDFENDGVLYQSQKLDIDRTFSSLNREKREAFGISSKKIFIKDRRLCFSFFYRKQQTRPYLLVVHDKNGRIKNTIKDKDNDGVFDVVAIYHNGVFESELACDISQPLSFKELNNLN